MEFRLPVVSGIFDWSMLGKKCELGVRDHIQGAVLDGKREDLLILNYGLQEIDNEKVPCVLVETVDRNNSLWQE